jgi:hypothetical protein
MFRKKLYELEGETAFLCDLNFEPVSNASFIIDGGRLYMAGADNIYSKSLEDDEPFKPLLKDDLAFDKSKYILSILPEWIYYSVDRTMYRIRRDISNGVPEKTNELLPTAYLMLRTFGYIPRMSIPYDS